MDDGANNCKKKNTLSDRESILLILLVRLKVLDASPNVFLARVFLGKGGFLWSELRNLKRNGERATFWPLIMILYLVTNSVDKTHCDSFELCSLYEMRNNLIVSDLCVFGGSLLTTGFYRVCRTWS